MGLSPYIVAVAVAWIVAQGTKFIIVMMKNRGKPNYRLLYTSGDMPSGHSATVVALATVIGLNYGLNSAVFALSLIFAAIVMYDAVMVRRSTGEQGEAIQALIKEQGSKVRLPRSAKGHEPLEVAAGAVVGLVIGLVTFLFVN